MTDERIHLAFVCVQNAGRSQMATALAERERERRGLENLVEITTGGTHPAEHVHGEVIESMAEVDVDLADREPRAVSEEDLAACDVVATMGCSTLSLDANTEVRDWALDDPDGEDPATVRRIRDEVQQRVEALFDDVEERLATGES